MIKRLALGLMLVVINGSVAAQVSSGTAFAVAPGLLVTNQHVVAGCSSVEVVAADGRRAGSIVDADSQIDLALLRVAGIKGATVRLRNPRNIRLGESVMVFGFPLSGSLSSGGNFTSGLVSGLRGLRDAAGEIQITAPVQRGNSGGPLLDASGLVIGVVQSKLDALHSAKVTGDIPQNVNFAISLDVLVDFLVKNKVTFRDGAPSAPLDTARVADLAQSFTYRIECRGRSQRAVAPPNAEVPPPIAKQPEAPPTMQPLTAFRDCDTCPEMVVIPVGSYLMGGKRNIEIARPFAIGKFELTLTEWDACFADRGCKHWPSDEGSGRSNQPARNISWDDAKQFVSWLSRKTGKSYRLPTEAEWEYAARAGSTTKYYWGDAMDARNAHIGGGSITGWAQPRTVAFGTPNAFGLYGVIGNVWEWVEDCFHANIMSVYSDGSARTVGDCSQRVIRGGGWDSKVAESNTRGVSRVGDRYNSIGFRLARTID